MRRQVAIVAALVLVLAVAIPASARRLEFGRPGHKSIWVPISIKKGPFTISCPLTLSGTFHSRTISKTLRSLIGAITVAASSPCTGGRLTVLRETLPWSIQYQSFDGTLPNIRHLLKRILGLSMSVQPEGSVACLFTTEESHPAVLIDAVEEGTVTSVRADETASIPTSGLLCELEEATLSGTGTVTSDTGEALGIRLVR